MWPQDMGNWDIATTVMAWAIITGIMSSLWQAEAAVGESTTELSTRAETAAGNAAAMALAVHWAGGRYPQAKKAVAQADEKATVEADGAIKWNSNGRYLMDDFCEKLEYAGYPFSREATAKKRDAQNEESIAEYRRNHRGLSGEALAEARAAFGEGTTVVNILTGERTKL